MLKLSRQRIAWGKWSVAGVLFASMLGAPLMALAPSAHAKPPKHAPAWGYRSKRDKDDRRHRRNRWDNDDRRKRRYSSKHRNRSQYRFRDSRRSSWKKRTNNRRYRTMYRTRRDRNGRLYRQYYRVYR